MLARSFRRFFAGKKKPIVNTMKASKAPKARKRPHLSLELLEDRVTPTTITQWNFASAPAVINTQNGTTGNTVNQFAAGVEPTTGSGSIYTLGMYNSYNGGNTASDDITLTAGTADSAFSENLLRVRGTSHNGWATHAAGAAQYTQGLEVDASTAGFTNISFSFDWYSTTQGIRDLQLQYNTNVTNAAGWTNFVAPGGTGSNGISTAGTFLATPNDYWNATSTNGADPITVTFGSYANNDANFGVRLVSAYDSTGNVPNDYAGAALSGGNTVIYNNSSGNWRFDNLTFSAGAASSTSALAVTPASPQNPGTSVTFTDTITPGSGTANPTGTVQFMDNGVALGSPVNVTAGSGNTGTATLTVNTSGSPLSLGVHPIYAVYSPTGSFAGSTSNTVNYTIGDPTSSVVTASPNAPQQVGSTVTFTDTITPANIGGTSSPDGSPTGTVQFFNGSTALGAPVAVTAGPNNTGVATYTDNGTLTSGAHNISAVFTPTGNYLGNTSPSLGYSLYSGTPGPFTPGDLVVLQAGDGVTQYNAQAPLFLNEVNPGTGANVQQVAIPAVGGVGNAANQPITIDLSAAAGNGQLNRSYDGSSLTFDGIDSTVNNGGLTAPATPTGQDNRVVAVVTGDPTVASDINTTTYGPFYVGDDNRGSVAESPTGPIYTAGHPNQAGGAVSQGVHEFDTEGPSIGTQVSASTNIRGVTIGFDNRMYFTTASGLGGASALNTAGIFTEAQALPTAANTPAVPASDIMVVPAIFGASKLGGVYLADMNGDGIIDNGDRLYFVDDGTVGGAGTGGLYVATWNDSITSNPWNTNAPGQGGNNAAAVAAGIINHWSAPVRLGDAPTQPGSGNVGQLRGLTGTVLSPTETQLYTTAYDNTANDSSYVQGWDDTHSGVAITSASESGTTVTITTLTPNGFATGDVVEVDGVGANNGAGAITSGYNGAWSITRVDSTHFTYTDTNAGASNLGTVTNQGAADVTVNATTVQTLASGSDTVGSKAVGDVGLRGVSFAPVAATSISLTGPSGAVTPGTAVTLTATLTNSQVTPTGQVAFIDQNTNTVLGFGTISTSGGVSTATFTYTFVGNHYVKAYFGGGGALDLASANSNTIQVIEAGTTASSVGLNASLSAAAIGKQDTLTATVNDPNNVNGTPTGTVSFYDNGAVSLANLLGTATLSGSPTAPTASLTTAFGSAGAHTIIAVYNGDNTYNSTSAQATVNVAANATATISTSANNVALNATPTYTATIVGNSTLGTPAGTVTFTIVSATTNGNGAPLVSTSSGAVTLTAGPNNTATATWTSPALSAPGSYFVTISYNATGTTNPYSNFAVTTTNASNGVALIETVQKAFTPGDLVAVQRGDGTVNLGSSAYPVELVEYKPGGGGEVQAIVLPDADSGSAHALFLSGQNSAEGLLNRSANGADLTLSGYDLPAGHTFITSTFPYQYPRTIAEVGASGSVDTSTAISTTQVGITAISESGTTVTATATTVAGLSIGQKVVITGVTPAGYDGQFTITGINAGANTFTYTAAAGLGAATVSSAFATSSSVPYNPLDVVSYNGQQFWLVSNLPVGDTTDSGIEYVGNIGATTATQIGASNTGAASVEIAGGQLYVAKPSGDVQAVGVGLPTTANQSLVGLPNLLNAYANFFPNTESPEQILLLNTTDGTTNNPNVAYIADQANGLLKFYLNSASIKTLSESGTTVTVTLTAANSVFQTGDHVQIAGASVAGYNGTYTITVTDSTHFTYTATASGLANATGGTASEWVYGSGGTGVFGQKLVFAGGATGVTGYVVNPGASAQVQLYITGSNVQQQNPNQIDSLLDTESPSQGFPTGNFTNLGFVGGASSTGSPNGNENFAGLAFVPGAVTTTTVSTTQNTYGNNVTLSATVSSPQDAPQGTVSFYFGNTLLGTSAFAGAGGSTAGSTTFTFTTTTPLPVGEDAITAVYNPGGTSLSLDDSSTGNGTQEIDYAHGDLIVSQVGYSSNIASVSVSGMTVTVTTTNPLPFAQNVTGLAVTVAGNSGTNVNGTYAITLTGPNSFTYTAALGAPTAGTGGTVSVGSSVGVTATSVATSGGITTVTVTTSASSGFSAGQVVTIAGTTGGTNINGNFVLTSVSGTTLKYISAGAVAATGFTGATAASVVPLSGSATAAYLDDFTVNPSTGATTQNTANTVALPTAVKAATINAATWSAANDTVTFTTAAAHNFQAGQLVTISGVSPSGYNGVYTILSVPTTTSFVVGLVADPGAYVSGGSAQDGQNALTEGGTATTSGYLTLSSDGHSLEIAGNDQTPGVSLSGALSDVGVVGANGSVNDSTLIASLAGSARAVASTDGSGFWVATSTGLDFVPFGGSTPSAISAASWSSVNGGTATITAPNNYVAGQSVYVTGIGGATGYNTPAAVNGYSTPFTVLSASSTQFTYALATQPTGTATFTSATSQLAPTLVSAAANNYGNSGQTPSTVTIGTDPNGNYPQLIADAGNQFQNNGEPSIDGPFTVGSGLPTTGGQSIGVYGTGTGQNFPNARDRFQNFPSSAQFVVSPDGQTVFVADSRTDGLGGILEYYQAVPNTWTLVGNLQLDNYSITGASESGTTVTITTSGPTDFYVGESVAVNGMALPSYNGSGNIVTSVSGNSFTFTSSFSGLSSSGPGSTGAFATGADGGMRALTADFTGGVVTLYATTSGTSGNRLIEVTGGTLDGSNANFSLITPALSTAAPGTAYRGVAFAPAAPGTTASTTSVSASGNVLTATVTSGATGWVEFFEGGQYVGTALINSGTATLNTTGVLPAGTYGVTATYTGNSTYAASSGTTSLTISPISTSTSLTFNPTTAATNAAETITAIISAPAGQNPTGLVTFTNTSTSTTLGYATVNQVITNVNGQPVVTYQAILSLGAGTFTNGTANISAAYSGDAYFASSTGTGSLSVVNGTTTTVTSSLANPNAATNQSVTLTATVTSPTGSGAYTGTVQFYDNTLALGAAQTISSAGVASVTVPTTLVQSVTVKSASATTNGGTTTVTITTDAAIPAALVGQRVTVEGVTTTAYNGAFTVTAVSGNTFSYVDNAANGAATNTKGGLAIFLNVLTPGLHSISAVFTPTGTTYGPSTGVHEQTVQGQAVGAADVFSERLGDGISSLNTQSPNPALGSIGATNYLDELTPSGTLVQSFILPSADSEVFTAVTSGTSATAVGASITLALTSPTDIAVGQTVTVAGVSAAADNGDFVVTAVNNTAGSYSVTYMDANAGTGNGTGGTVQGVVHAVVGDGQQSTTGQMTLSGDGQSLFLTGYDNNPLPFGTALPVPTGGGSASNAVPRAIAKFNFDGSIQTEAFTSNSGTITTGINSTGNFNGVYSPDGNQFYVAGSNGIYYFPSLVQSATLQGNSNSNLLVNPGFTVNALESYGGNLYAIGGTHIVQVGAGLPTTNVQAVTGVTWASGTATLTLPSTTGFAIGSSVLVSGITGTTGTSYNGTVTLTGVTATTISYALATQPTGTPNTTGALASLQAPVTQLPGFPTQTSQTEPIPISSGGTDAYFTHLNGAGNALDTIYVGDRGSSFGLGAITKWSLTSVNISSITESGTTATVTLASPALGLAVGQPITITLAGNTPSAYNGTFSITPTSATTFTFTAPSGTGNSTVNGTASAYVEAPGGILYSQSAAQLGYYYLAGQTNPTTGAVTLYATYGNGGNGDFGPGLTYQVLDTDGFNKSPGVAITAISWSGGTVTVTANNNFVAGNIVDVEGVTGATGYNGQYTILSATPTSFTYALSSNPGAGTVTNAIATSVNTVNSVAFEGPGGGFLGSETTRGVALAPLAAVQSVVLDGIAGAVTTATESGTTVTITTATPLGFITGEVVTIAGDSVAGYNGTFKITGVSGNTFTYTDSASGLANGTGGTATFALAGAQRSMVDTVVYKFNQAVTLGANAFTFNVHGTASIVSATESGTTVTITTAANHGFVTGQVVTIAGVGVAGYNGTYTITVTSPTTFTYTDSTSGLANSSGGTAGVGQAPTVTYSSPDGGLTWIVSWSGAGVSGSSIADGVYDILLNPSAVTYNYSGATLTQSNRLTDTFFRLYGDTNGDKIVNNTDNLKFKSAFGKSVGQAGFLDALDYNNDGLVNNTDNLQFKKRFGFSLSGFSSTI